ncbi:hypothetical protein GCM10017687_78330 [Streptomyces echinatus]
MRDSTEGLSARIRRDLRADPARSPGASDARDPGSALMSGAREGRPPRQPLPDLHVRLRSELGRIDEQLRSLLSSMDRLQGLLDAGGGHQP